MQNHLIFGVVEDKSHKECINGLDARFQNAA
jgi:hypothetical protein